MKKINEMVCTECDHKFVNKTQCPRCGSRYIEFNQGKVNKKPPRKEKWRDND